MLQMVLLEGDARRQALRTVRDHAQNFVVTRLLETQVVGELVIPERQPVRQRPSDAPAEEEPLPSLESSRINGQTDLGRYDGQDHWQKPNIGTVQFLDLGMLRQDCLAASEVWLISADTSKACSGNLLTHAPEKIVLC